MKHIGIYKKLHVVITFFLLSLNTGYSQVEKFQAAYIYNFTRFIEWPAEYLSGNFIIGILGSDPIEKELKTLASAKKILGKTIEVKSYSSVSAITKCNVLFLPGSKTSKIGEVNSKLGSGSTLLVTNGNGAIANGSGINFFLSGGKLSFEIKSSNITSKGMKVNSQLENLAAKKH